MSRPSLIVRVSLSAAALFTLVAACGGDDPGATSPSIRNFCNGYASASAFSCCQPAERKESSFGLRYRFSSAAECASVLSAQESSAAGRQGFDKTAADACLAHLNARECGGVVTKAVLRAEREAGCARVLTGNADEGQQCQSSDDCKLGLVCPPIRETGLAFCAKPAIVNQTCYGQQADSVDHPACAEGLLCSFIEANNNCPSPPCNVFKCVPPFELDEPCAATECAAGLACKFNADANQLRCQAGGPSGTGEQCRVIEHCATGLYCDTGTGTCAARKSEGAECRIANNALYECNGVCKGTGESGTCAAFCGR